MSTRGAVIASTVTVWCAASAVYAYFRAIHLINSSLTEPGHEKMLSFQMLTFAVSRLPWLVIVLALAVWLETKFLPREHQPK
jgi:hypothetical protein